MKKTILQTILVLFIPFNLFALELGEMKVYSHVDQPFYAEIPLVHEGAISPGELKASIGTAEEFAQAGFSRNKKVLSSLRLAIKRKNKRLFIELRSVQPIQISDFMFLVELTGADEQLYRAYSVKLASSNDLALSSSLPTLPGFEVAPIVSILPSISEQQETVQLENKLPIFRMSHLEEAPDNSSGPSYPLEGAIEGIKQLLSSLEPQVLFWFCLFVGNALTWYGWARYLANRIPVKTTAQFDEEPDYALEVKETPLMKSKEALETLLALVKAYVSRGEVKATKQMLEEVMRYGDKEQQNEAGALLNQ